MSHATSAFAYANPSEQIMMETATNIKRILLNRIDHFIIRTDRVLTDRNPVRIMVHPSRFLVETCIGESVKFSTGILKSIPTTSCQNQTVRAETRSRSL